jgi:mannose-6-phosphate isomerase-like protein (cupin superfamily)
MSFRVMCYAPGIGENRMHAHLEEDHIFVVMEGEAQFSTLDGPLPVVGRHRAIVLPKGCFYRFSNPGSGPLVLLRFGAAKAISEARARIDPDGRPIGGRSTEDGAARPTVIENAFFE